MLRSAALSKTLSVASVALAIGCGDANTNLDDFAMAPDLSGTGAAPSNPVGTGGLDSSATGGSATLSGGSSGMDGSGGTGSPAPVDCSPLSRDGIELCSVTDTSCSIVYNDSTGCSAACAEAGLACAQALENTDSCAGDTTLPALSCDSGHQSDFCVCSGPLDGGGGATSTGGASSTGGANATGGTSSTGGSAGSGGSTGACDTPPQPSTLVGWAASSKYGLSTTSGGGNATPEVVTTSSALKTAVSGTAAKVIYVKGKLSADKISLGSNKTIVGLCGAEIHGSLQFKASSNVILRNITVVGYGEGDCSLDPGYDSSVGCSSGSDAISIVSESHHIWIDHCEVRDGTDGNLDITNGADYITVSWTRFTYTARSDNQGDDKTFASGHRYSNLIGGTDNPSSHDDQNALNVTWHHNHWSKRVVERMPRVRFGQNHLFNNLFDSDTSNYCVRAGRGARILLQNNYFDGVKNPHEFNNDTDKGTANISSSGNYYSPSVTGSQSTGGGGTAWTSPSYSYSLETPAAARTAILTNVGPQ